MAGRILTYSEKDTWIHRLSGVSKMIFFLLWSLTGMLTYDTRVLLVMLVCSLVIFKVSHTEWKQVGTVFQFILLFLCINMLAVWLFSPNQGTVIYGTKTELLHLFGNHNITKEQLFYQFNIMLKYLTVTPVVLMFIVTTNPSEFAASLNRMGVSYNVGYAIAIALRYIPDVQSDFTKIKHAQEARGIEMSNKTSLWTRIKRMSTIIFPLLFSSMDRIDVVSNAMELRGFGKNKKRTWYMGKKLVESAGGKNSMMFGGTGKSGAKVYVQSTQGIHFEDVAGEDEAKESLAEIVDYLHNPQKYTDVGASMPKGVLLVGPPGTGKTMLAKAVAGEANVPFFSMSGSEFVEMFVGMGASKVRDLFKQANEKAPCIIFIDEIDTIGKKRDGASGMGGNDEREQTLNQLLTEMDGFDAAKGVIILAATNRPESLDPALTRPGRFDRRVPVELPDLKGRESILRLHAQKVKIGPDCDFAVVARMTPGASGAELANIINEAALGAVRHHRMAVTQYDLQEAVDTILAGAQKKNKILSDKEKCIVAYHEVGHAMVAALQSHSAPVQKITIVPRTSGALGFTMQVEDGDHALMTKEEILAKIATMTGGRAAEEVVFNSITTGASNDIEQATKMARAMITRYGMTDDFDMVALETVNNAYLGGDASLACSERTAATVDDKVVEVVKQQHEKAKQMLIENRGKLDEIAKYLYEKETITGEEFMRILTAVPQLPTGAVEQ